MLQLTYAGMSSGLTAMLWEHENMAAHARMAAGWFTEAGLALQAKSRSAEGPGVLVGSMLYNEIPL